MARVPYLPVRVLTALKRIYGDDRASQIAEFAVSLPLLVLFVVGIFDFSSAVTLKQKLTNAAREGARVAAADPANDLVGTTTGLAPISVMDAWQVADAYLVSEKINDCGLSLQRPSPNGVLIWTSTASGCPGGVSAALVLTINRGCVTTQTAGSTPTYVVNTCVTIRYPYTWQFGGVSGLFGGSFTLPVGITTTAVAFNEN
jgi:Flp pilus assembly protein TadG